MSTRFWFVIGWWPFGKI